MSIMSRWVQAFIVVILIGGQAICGFAGPFKGTAGGNPLVNPDFDFSMKNAPYWVEETRLGAVKAASDRPVEVWSLRNMESGHQQSSMTIEFYSGVAVESVAELGDYLRAKYPDLIWSDYTDRKMVGFRSNEVLDPSDPGNVATLGRLVYFMHRRMIVSVAWRRHPAAGGATDVTNLIASMDRYTAPPVIKSVTMEPRERVAAGERACYYIKVDDLKSSFNDASLTDFKIVGLPDFWVWTDLRWLERDGAYEVCLTIPRRIKNRNDLSIARLRMRNERDQSIDCRTGIGFVEPRLVCNSSYLPGQGDSVDVPLSVPEVDNSNPDLTAPKIDSLGIDSGNGRYILSGVVRDDSAVSGGWLLLKEIPGDNSQVFIAPWQIIDGKFAVDLTAESGNGTRRVNELIFSDEHGNVSRLMVCLPGEMTCDRMNYHHCTQYGNRERCQETQIPIVEYFSQRMSKKY